MWQYTLNAALGILIAGIGVYITSSFNNVLGAILIGSGLTVFTSACWGFYDEVRMFEETHTYIKDIRRNEHK